MRNRLVPLLAAALLVPAVSTVLAAQSAPLDSATIAAFRWRNIGPANMSGRVTDLEVDPANRKVWYVATATGGIWKTINAGTTFFPLFDREKVVSLGDIAIAPSNPQVLYAGTGEEDSRNSISPGGGVYKSIDGGKTWTLSGLEKTEAIGRILVHPTDENTAWVAALGHIWNTNPERGLYKTTDGGKSWRLVKFVSDKAGFVDLAMDPRDPKVLWAASWDRQRGPYFLRSGGPGSLLWKSTDGGETWAEVKGGGFPAVTKGRIGLAVAPSNGDVVYAWVEADTMPNPKKGVPEKLAPGEPVVGLGGDVPRRKTLSGIYRSADGGKTWTRTYTNEDDARPFYYSQIRVDPKNPDRIYWMSSVFRYSDDGGKTVGRGSLSIHTDWHAMWIDPTDPDFFITGNDGGIAVTHDKGGTYDFINTFAIGQFYAIGLDMSKPYKVCGGLQDNGSWCGPSRTNSRFGIQNEDWYNVGGGDGFFAAIDPTNPNTVYGESQGGNLFRLDLASGDRMALVRGGGRGRRGLYEDSSVVARGDTTKAETPEVRAELARIAAAAKADSARQLRYNWSMPFFISPHSPTTLYAAGSRVMKSVNRGTNWRMLSPDLSTKDSLRIRISTKETGGLTKDATGAETHGTITSISESPMRAGLLWAGTDDGNVWMTRDDGGTWTDVTAAFKGMVPPRSWVSRVAASAHDSGTVYVTFDNHRENDFRPYVFASSDFGRTFRAIAGGLPQDGPAFVHVIAEDPRNRDLLFVGTDVGAYVSADRGTSWQRFMTGLPTVPVHDLKIHPRDREIVAGTHGRSIYVADIAGLEELVDSVRARPAAILAVGPAYQYAPLQQQAWNGNKLFAAENPPFGATITYRVAGTPMTASAERTQAGSQAGMQAGVQAGVPSSGPAGDNGAAAATRVPARDSATVVVTDVRGDTVRVLRGAGGAGIHRVTWDLRRRAGPLSPSALRDSVATAIRTRQREDSVRAARAATGDTAAAGRDSSGRGRMARRGTDEPNLRPAEAPPSAGGGGGGGGGGGRGFARVGSFVAPGEYLVTITVAGQTMRQTVKVERVSEISEADGDYWVDERGFVLTAREVEKRGLQW